MVCRICCATCRPLEAPHPRICLRCPNPVTNPLAQDRVSARKPPSGPHQPLLNGLWLGLPTPPHPTPQRKCFSMENMIWEAWGSGKVCGTILRSISSKFHGIWSREIVVNSICMIWGFWEKPFHHRIPQNLSPSCPMESNRCLSKNMTPKQNDFPETWEMPGSPPTKQLCFRKTTPEQNPNKHKIFVFYDVSSLFDDFSLFFKKFNTPPHPPHLTPHLPTHPPHSDSHPSI
jgi:hypothetical protein